jgi:hypothetical protein
MIYGTPHSSLLLEEATLQGERWRQREVTTTREGGEEGIWIQYRTVPYRLAGVLVTVLLVGGQFGALAWSMHYVFENIARTKRLRVKRRDENEDIMYTSFYFVLIHLHLFDDPFYPVAILQLRHHPPHPTRIAPPHLTRIAPPPIMNCPTAQSRSIHERYWQQRTNGHYLFT